MSYNHGIILLFKTYHLDQPFSIICQLMYFALFATKLPYTTFFPIPVFASICFLPPTNSTRLFLIYVIMASNFPKCNNYFCLHNNAQSDDLIH